MNLGSYNKFVFSAHIMNAFNARQVQITGRFTMCNSNIHQIAKKIYYVIMKCTDRYSCLRFYTLLLS